MLIDGKRIAEEIRETLRALSAPQSSICAVLVGDDPSSKVFIRQKARFADSLGIPFLVRELPGGSDTKEIIAALGELGADEKVGGIILQLPLPKNIDRAAVLAVLPSAKDVDCLSPQNYAAFKNGSDGLMPPAAGAVLTITRSLGLRLGSLRAAVVGRGLLVGEPAAIYLGRHAERVEALGREDDLAKRLPEADLIVSGAGKENLISADHVRAGAVVIDFGFPHDADFEAIDKKGGIVTPTPGGTGPIVVAKLFENFYRLQSSI